MKFLKKINLIWIFIITTPLFIWGIITYGSSSQKQLSLLALAALVYLIIAMLHHLKDKTLKLEVFVEYIIIAILAIIVLQTLLI